MYHHYDPFLPSSSFPSPTTLLPPFPEDLGVSACVPSGYNYSYSMLEPSSRSDLLETQPAPMRRVFSTGDLEYPFRYEIETGSTVAALMGGGRVGRYNAEERKERIERYRSKRSHRNFQKKITYACRKTLADSRPRVRGRFARNGELEVESEGGFYDNGGGEMGSGCCSWNGLGEIAGFTVDHGPTAASGPEEEDEYCFNGELWANFLDVFSMNHLVSE